MFYQSLYKLKILELSDSKKLIKTPDLTGAPNLEMLILQGCVSLLEVHPSVGALKRLTLLNLKDCKSLTSLPFNISLDSLETLILSGCSKLDKMPKDLGNMVLLEEIDASRTTGRQAPSSIPRLKSLEHLLDFLFDSEPDIGLVSPNSFLDLHHLRTLDLSYCVLPDGGIPNDLGNLSSRNKFELIPV